MIRPPPRSTLFPSPTLSRSRRVESPRPPAFCELLPAPPHPRRRLDLGPFHLGLQHFGDQLARRVEQLADALLRDRKSTRLNSSHGYISYAVFCLKKKKKS